MFDLAIVEFESLLSYYNSTYQDLLNSNSFSTLQNYGVNVTGPGITVTQMSNTSSSDCIQDCSSNPNCVGCTYDQSGNCIMYEGSGNSISFVQSNNNTTFVQDYNAKVTILITVNGRLQQLIAELRKSNINNSLTQLFAETEIQLLRDQTVIQSMMKKQNSLENEYSTSQIMTEASYTTYTTWVFVSIISCLIAIIIFYLTVNSE